MISYLRLLTAISATAYFIIKAVSLLLTDYMTVNIAATIIPSMTSLKISEQQTFLILSFTLCHFLFIDSFFMITSEINFNDIIKIIVIIIGVWAVFIVLRVESVDEHLLPYGPSLEYDGIGHHNDEAHGLGNTEGNGVESAQKEPHPDSPRPERDIHGNVRSHDGGIGLFHFKHLLK